MPDLRYALFLRPSLSICRAVAAIHHLLARQYDVHAAARFPPHVTIKGFFKSDASVAEMVERVDGALAGMAPFTVRNHGVVPILNTSIVLNVHGTADEDRNLALIELDETVLGALLPIVSPDCDFTPHEWKGPLYFAHLTLAMADVPERFFDEILEFVKETEPIGPPTFPAEVVQLIAFESEAWSGRWWQSLRWELLHSWRLSTLDGPRGE